MKRLILLLTPLLLAACASAPASKEVPLAAADKDTVCERESSTGTSLKTVHCRTAAQRDAEQRAVEATADSLRRGPTISTLQKPGS